MDRLLHPASRLESLAAPVLALSADGLIEAVRGAAMHAIDTVKSWSVEPLGQHAAIAGGRVRYRYGPGGFTDERRVWATTEHEGLIRCMRIFHDRQHALSCFGKHGLDLGL
jgi:hypothetical protein